MGLQCCSLLSTLAHSLQNSPAMFGAFSVETNHYVLLRTEHGGSKMTESESKLDNFTLTTVLSSGAISLVSDFQAGLFFSSGGCLEQS